MAQKINPESKEIEEGKILAVIAYLWVLCILTLLLKKDNKFASFHGKQGFVLFLLGLINGIVAMAIPLISWIFTIPFSLALLICTIFGLIQALLGNYARIPVVSEIADKIKI